MNVDVIDAAFVHSHLSMSECIDSMAVVMAAVTDGNVAMPPRTIMQLVGGGGYLGVMPASAPQVYGAKVVSLHPRNMEAGRPVIQGFVALFDPHTGAPNALVDGAAITAMRTGASSGLATRLLARREARTLGLLGYGVQASSHLDAICAVRDIEEVRVWGPSIVKARDFAERHESSTKAHISAVATAEQAADCDVVCAATSAREPVIRGAFVRPGTHVNLIGAHTPNTREADTALIARARLFVDSIASACREAGDILVPIEEGAIDQSHIIGEIGALLLGAIEGRRSVHDITVYKSLGLAAQDLIAAHEVHKRWMRRGRADAV